jgi:hypothetical protein
VEADHLIPEWLEGEQLRYALRQLDKPDDFDLQCTANRAPLDATCNKKLKGPDLLFLPAVASVLVRAKDKAPAIEAEIASLKASEKVQGLMAAVLASVDSPAVLPAVQEAAELLAWQAGGPPPTVEPPTSPAQIADSPPCAHCFGGVTFCPDCWNGSQCTGKTVEAGGKRHPYPSTGASIWAKGAEPEECWRCHGLGAIRCPFCCGTGRSGWDPPFHTGDLVAFDPSVSAAELRSMVGLVPLQLDDGHQFSVRDWMGFTFEIMDYRVPIQQTSGPHHMPEMAPADIAYALATTDGLRRVVAYALGRCLSLVSRPEPNLRLQ